MRTKPWLSVALFFLYHLPLIISKRNLSEITYHFTTCGKQGRYGPTYEDCINYYDNSDLGAQVSQVLTQQSGFVGGQQFTFPRNGSYVIRIAGASGGRGLCNNVTGLGTAFSLEVNIEENVNDTYLILVGQKGVSPCDTNPGFFLCSEPLNVTSCYNTWQGLMYDNTGGGGGGGGSMLWPQNIESYSADILPLIAASGGAGTNVNLDLTPFGSNLTEYISWCNGQQQQNTMNKAGLIGNAFTDDNTNGFGAGWTNPNTTLDLDFRSDKDAYLLSQSQDFGVGGGNCSAASEIPFTMVTGGFGGGGGACSQGGGGGGYGGGAAFLNPQAIIGQGGFSLTPSTATMLPFNDGDGYVRIYPLDCNCPSRECVINGDSYTCVCNDGSTLHTNGLNCVRVSSIMLPDPTTVLDGRLYSLYSFDQSYLIYDAVVRFMSPQSRRKRAVMEEPVCVAVFVNSSGVPVLVSSASAQDNYTSVGVSVLTGNSSLQHMTSLQDGLEVGGVMVLSGCVIDSLSVTEDDNLDSTTGPLTMSLVDILSDSLSTLSAIASQFNAGTVSTTTAYRTTTGYRTHVSTMIMDRFISISLSTNPVSPSATILVDNQSIVIPAIVVPVVLVVVSVCILTSVVVSVIVIYRMRRAKSCRKNKVKESTHTDEVSCELQANYHNMKGCDQNPNEVYYWSIKAIKNQIVAEQNPSDNKASHHISGLKVVHDQDPDEEYATIEENGTILEQNPSYDCHIYIHGRMAKESVC